MPTMATGGARCLYDVLGVDPGCSADDLRRAHRALALRLHPDKGGDSGQFQEVNAAYETLKDPASRRLYDAGLGGDGWGGPAEQQQQQQRDVVSLAALVKDLLGKVAGKKQREMVEAAQNERLVVSHRMPLADAWSLTPQTVCGTRRIPCRACGAHGSVSGRAHACKTCDGQGVTTFVPFIVSKHNIRVCADCEGSGRAPPRADRCGTCLGSCAEEVAFEEAVDLDQGEGSLALVALVPGAGGLTGSSRMRPADLEVRFEIEPEPGLSLGEGGRLHAMVRVTLAQALCGTRVRVAHPRGAPVLIKVSRGVVVRPGAQVDVRGLGMPLAGGGRGPLVVTFGVEFPERMDRAQVDAIGRALGYDSEGEMMSFHTHLVDELSLQHHLHHEMP
jgi:DnaJ-class molecular chaperone